MQDIHPRIGRTAARRSALRRVLTAREISIVFALAVLVAVTAGVRPAFVHSQSIRDILLGAAIVAVLAVGQTVVMITRSVDLSVGSILGLSAYAAGTVLSDHPGLPVVLVLGMAVGACCASSTGCSSGSATFRRWSSPSARCTCSAVSPTCGPTASRSTPTSSPAGS
nr:hypothetical protein [Parafrankia sp. CH37]